MTLESYADIRERIAEAPKWWDEAGVPRYCDFAPDQCSNIGANEVALVLIACQGCGRKFRVAMSWGPLDELFYEERFRSRPLSERIPEGAIHYGDPPNVGCCAAGYTMNCEDLRVIEFWRRERFDFVREPQLEIDLPDLKV